MKVIFVVCLAVAASYADRLENVYLPPAGAAGAGGAGLPPPLQGVAVARGAGAGAGNGATILRYDSQADEQGYQYAFETSDGTKVDQQGRVIPGADAEHGSLNVAGSYTYIGDDGQQYSVSYTADENGYQAQGAHLPTPPPVPEAILKALQQTAAIHQSTGVVHHDSGSSAGYKY